MTTLEPSEEPRIQLAESPYSEAVALIMNRAAPALAEPLLLFRALAVNERVFARVMAGGLLDRGSISIREREIIIARTTFRCGAEYEWGVHVATYSSRAGFTPQQVRELCAKDPATTAFCGPERSLLLLCDELHDTASVSDGLWKELSSHYTARQLVEIVAVAGYYHLIAFVVNTFRLPNEYFGARFESEAPP
ncbi:carboxymuconolactone decarboxylase family protein [Pendulispora albinea]|uniref:Carboxymuconolactone decarboxylase family protein n=1 Tax=Pendulispora albinea TaxID=2741071 RepID=A0ABZ2LPX6_9BACT